MTDQIITCPNCNTEIPLNTALTEKIQLQLRKQMSLELQAEKEKMAELEKNLKLKEQDVQKIIDTGIASERQKIALEAKNEASKKVELELRDLQQANSEKDQKLKEMEKAELDLRRQKREIEEREKSMKLELERQIDQERAKIVEETKREASEEARLKVAEKDKQIAQMNKTIEDLKRKGEQGSMQIQGDVQENDLRDLLQNIFPVDNIADVPTGIRGADLIQTVHTKFGQEAGIMLWESKNTKAWSNDWVKKLRDDQGLAKADVCILISQTLPEGITDFGLVDGVWVSNYQSAPSLATVLRANILQVAQVKQSLVGKDQKMELLYSYLSGSEFRHHIENIVSAFSSMRSDLDSEKRSMQRIWKKREKEIERVTINTSSMYGDLQGLIGASLQTIQALELPGSELLEEDFDE
ncbi:DUF2130 domain-containing protein [Candidatus Uhrbacteria bacterium CG_4_10_14_0_2_um_filter_41_7]|uniref:DUF2130 domain-containing protein n=1 Tax=Candidatus Uhrbacteria bacterium CG_4_9_14_3_um_filter_41_35 TaxID=1975034 RepID=A0A2M7XFF4_9BACT|nr:MAG: hypothetical protein COV92_03180 [Candidatus Uhrbacteria bacterium CG11_big_fil_rev_8_21_14_0_20_41_9]PIZ54074.1 MAG: DUF2130 domain-containing protein [Candidatus Uhrbacteria bacterium CG_4_10_14_0_2_um_filter_41_7]PJA46466.1 MAG: DUF2130 domain-containing protein [Candidatus Uhrbacteria bacterium CG_4_9_14_3_um_filter_41_35]